MTFFVDLGGVYLHFVDIARKLIDENIHERPVLVYGDPDVDGMISLLLVTHLLEDLGVRYSYYVNENRHHGFVLDTEALRNSFIICVDFEVKQEILESLVKNNCIVISLDHHDIQEEPIILKTASEEVKAVVINNQYPFEPDEDRYLSGAGVVYEVFKEAYPEYTSKEREALVGITLLSDARAIENSKARRYLKTLYSSDSQSGYLGYLVSNVLESDFGFGVPKFDRNFVDYTFSPRINSMIRFGYENEAVDFILGRGLRVSGTKERQANLLQAMKLRASYLDLENIKIIALDSGVFPDYAGVNLDNFIGLMCNDVKGTGKSVLGFTFHNGEVSRASFRGRYDDVQYRKMCVDIGLDAQGHAGAFGILNFTPTKDLWVKLNEVTGIADASHVQTAKVIETSNLAFTMMQKGMAIANENCYVRDMYRTYLKYTGSKRTVIKETFKTEPLTQEDISAGVKPDKTVDKVPMKYVLNSDGEKVPKYIEYVIDGQRVKSFGTPVSDGVILPILEKGGVQLYVREPVN